MSNNDIKQFIIENVQKHPRDIAAYTATTKNISRQAVNRHLQQLIADGVLTASGKTRSREYALAVMAQSSFIFLLTPDAQEDVAWRDKVRPLLTGVPANVLGICQFGFTEMLNNAIDHSGGTIAMITVRYTADLIEITLFDDGVGIFNKIQQSFNLDDKRQAILELAKGKLTTDPKRHTGEGIFFSIRVFDTFSILSEDLYFSHQERDWLLEDGKGTEKNGKTFVTLGISPTSQRTMKEVIDRFEAGEEMGFSKTIIPVALAKYGDENLVSRSQAKRLLTRINRFREVIFDFQNVSTVGQAFADEIFRVFAQDNPDVQLTPIHMNVDVQHMYIRAINYVPPSQS
ncbi:MAG: DUF4325 domain-containing protein [Herpetosiphonaceae bacterium]|nr:DUF4325 domain-containing protein [Herpetosiphonaceae bacterium]